MEGFENLLILYAGILLVNTVLALLMWHAHRWALHRALVFLWASSVVTFLVQGFSSTFAPLITFGGTELIYALGYGFAFSISLSLSHLLSLIIETTVRWRLYTSVMAACVVASCVFSVLDAPFYVMALPVSLGIAVPMVMTLVIDIRPRYHHLSLSTKGLAISTVFYVIHTMDFPFLRLVDEFTLIGFTIATLLLFALSVFAPAVVLETVTARETMATAEIAVARRIQMEILPKNPQIPGYHLECFMKPADEVGGDYYDIFTLGNHNWILLGDVTGHGLSSGLVMLMAQSIIRSIVQTKPDISPKELNTLANRVLFENLQRLNDARTMTIVSFCRREETDQFDLSGIHDNIYVWRAATHSVESIEVGHFPVGLGLLEEISHVIESEMSLTLNEGDLLFLGTDGITEAASEGDYKRGLFDENRLVSFLAKRGAASLEEIKHALLEEVTRFTGGVFHDDITFVMIRKTEGLPHEGLAHSAANSA